MRLSLRLQQTLLIASLALPCLANAADNDLLQAALEESRSTGKGLNIYVNGQSIPGVVVAVGEKYVLARSTAQGTIVIRLDRIDAVAGTLPATAERKPN